MTPEATISTPEPDLLVLRGDIDLHASPRVREVASRMLESQPPRILIDLSGVAYMDSSGIAVLIEALQSAQAYGGNLALFGIPPTVRKIFEIAQLDQVFNLFPNAAAARA